MKGSLVDMGLTAKRDACDFFAYIEQAQDPKLTSRSTNGLRISLSTSVCSNFDTMAARLAFISSRLGSTPTPTTVLPVIGAAATLVTAGIPAGAVFPRGDCGSGDHFVSHSSVPKTALTKPAIKTLASTALDILSVFALRSEIVSEARPSLRRAAFSSLVVSGARRPVAVRTARNATVWRRVWESIVVSASFGCRGDPCRSSFFFAVAIEQLLVISPDSCCPYLLAPPPSLPPMSFHKPCKRPRTRASAPEKPLVSSMASRRREALGGAVSTGRKVARSDSGSWGLVFLPAFPKVAKMPRNGAPFLVLIFPEGGP